MRKFFEIIGVFLFINLIHSCEKEDDTVTDIDGNVYPVVTIGYQVWIAENLKTTKLRDGSPIPLVTDGIEWINLTSPGYCLYDKETLDNNIYGAYYNWYAVQSDKLCPVGWHVPSQQECWTLINYLGGRLAAGGKLKEKGLTHWKSPNTGATDMFGFTALPGGKRGEGSNFIEIGGFANFYCRTEAFINHSWSYWLGYGSIELNFSEAAKFEGLSVRCLKD